jgi:tetratricopeptide (TPR) repeat protein
MKRIESYILITIVITSCLLSACSKPRAAETPESIFPPEQISAALTQAETAFNQRDGSDRFEKALAQLDAVRSPGQRSFEVEWKFAKYSYFLGKETADQAESERIFERGRDAGNIASRLEPNKPDGYFWFAANLGEMSRRSPITVGIKSVDDIREAMNKVIELDPGYQNASAYDGLAQLELATRLTNGGSAEKAVELLQKGLTLSQDNAYLHLHLGEALLAVKKDAEARRQLDQVLKMKPNPEYVPEHQECVARAKKLIETNF